MDFEKNIQNISKISALENKEDRVGRVELESTWDELSSNSSGDKNCLKAGKQLVRIFSFFSQFFRILLVQSINYQCEGKTRNHVGWCLKTSEWRNQAK